MALRAFGKGREAPAALKRPCRAHNAACCRYTKVKAGVAAKRQQFSRGPRYAILTAAILQKSEPASGSEGLGSVGRDGKAHEKRFRRDTGSRWIIGKEVGVRIAGNKKPRFRWEAGLREILGSTRLSGRYRPAPASVGRRVTGKGHSFIRQRACALNRGTDDPAPRQSHPGIEDALAFG